MRIRFLARALAVLAILFGVSKESLAQLPPIMCPPMASWGVYTCVSTAGSICGQAWGCTDFQARSACMGMSIAYCYRSY